MAVNAGQLAHLLETRDRLPSTEELERRLRLAAGLGGRVEILSRDWNWHSSTFPSETLTCRVGRSVFRLFCKHFLPGIGHVYRRLLSTLSLSLPRFIGAWADEASGSGMLMIESLAHGCRITKTVAPERTLVDAARWIGSFHRATAARVTDPELRFLRRLDQDFYVDRIERLLRLEHGGR